MTTPRFLPALSLFAAFFFSSPAFAGYGGTQPGDLMVDGFIDADYCGQCHGGGYMGDYSFMPSDTWTGTMMGNAARDPVFFAALTVANQDAPDSGSFCMHCHTTIGYVRGNASPADGSMLDSIDRQGVGCDTCHRALTTPGPEGPYLLGNAQLVYSEDTTKHGPYQGAVSMAHTTAAEPMLGESRFCGQCHRVTNPWRKLRDENGAETSEDFPLDITYEEWAASEYAIVGAQTHASCQDCHMRPKLGSWPVSDQPDSPLRKNPRRHDFVGGNAWGIRAVMEANPDRAQTYEKEYSMAISRTDWMLRSAVTVKILNAPANINPGEMLELTIRVENLTGHKFPTGYAEGRRAWVAVALADGDLSDGDLKERTLLGNYDDATGEIAPEPSTHIYRAHHGRWDGTQGVSEQSLVLQDMILSDTRIPPKGFQPTLITMPVGEIDYGDAQQGYRNWDEFTAQIQVPQDWHGQTTLLARVYYQSMTREHIEFLASENTSDTRGTELLSIYEATGAAAPMMIAQGEWALMVGPQDPGLPMGKTGVPEEAGGCSLGRRADALPVSGSAALLFWMGYALRRRRPFARAR